MYISLHLLVILLPYIVSTILNINQELFLSNNYNSIKYGSIQFPVVYLSDNFVAQLIFLRKECD